MSDKTNSTNISATAKPNSSAGAVARDQSIATVKVTAIEQDRVKRWRDQRAKNSSVTYKEVDKNLIGIEIKNKDLSPKDQSDLVSATLCAISGTSNIDHACLFIAQTSAAMFKERQLSVADVSNVVTDLLLSFEPQDAIESMLCARLIVLHNHYMNYMTISTTATTLDVLNSNINCATKLMRLYNETLDALNRHRRKGEQRVTVQHVNVSNGGQAVVAGQLNQEGADGKK